MHYFLQRSTSKLSVLLLTLAFLLAGNVGWGQTYYSMASGNYSETFTSWSSPSSGVNWSAVGVLSSGSIPSATKTTVSSASFLTGTSGGLQNGSTNIQFLSTGSTSNTNSVAFDLNLNFSGRTAGTFSFDVATVFNSTGDRVGTLKLFYTTDGTTWSELSGTNLPYIAINNVTGSAGISIALPSDISNKSSVTFRFYNYNGSANGTNGSRPKISIDNVSVTSTASAFPSIAPNPTSLSGFSYSVGSGPSAASSFAVTASNLTAGGGDITFTPSNPAYYEVSKTSATSGFATSVVLPYGGTGTFTNNTIWVRLKAGLTAGSYNGETIAISGGGATTNVSLSGSVTAAPPPNDLCANALALIADASSTSGTLNNATYTSPFSTNDVWYKFTPSTSNTYKFTIAGFNGDVDIELYDQSGSCPTTTAYLEHSNGSTSTEIISYSLTGGTTYYLRVLAYNTAANSSTFTAQVQTAVDYISLTTLGTAISEDFNALANTGASSTLPNGWFLLEANAGSGSSADASYTAGTGSDNSGNTYSFGSASSTERAFGTLRSGSLISTIGAKIKNSTGSTITSLVISYTGEQWRLGTTGRADRLDFQYSTNANSLTTGTYTDADNLDFSSPVIAGITGAVNGNINSTQITYTLTGLNITAGATFWIKWNDFDATGADDGLGIDDFSIAVPNSESSANFQTKGSGEFSMPSTWQYNDYETHYTDASQVPGTSNNISVLHALTLDQDYTVGAGKTLTIGTGGTLTINPTRTFAANGNVDFGGKPVIVKSDNSGTGAIGQLAGTIAGATNITVERYIPEKPTRKWTLLASPVQAAFGDGWQQQMFITGPGTGGNPCAADNTKYNSNGFDDTQNDPSTVYTYEAGLTNNSHFTPIANTTSVNQQPGKGYRVNVRGDRTVANACQDQINYTGSTPAAGAVTLKVTGSYVSSLNVNLNDATQHLYTLLGNPYPASLSFSAFQTANSSKINNKAWVYEGTTANTTDVYSTYNAGTVTGPALPTENTPTGDLVISSGQAFFVEAASVSNGLSVSFAENQKYSSSTSGGGIFSKGEGVTYNWPNRIRVNLLGATDDVNLDNIVIRFTDDASVKNNVYGDFDAISLNPASNSISSMKAGSRMAIQTRTLKNISGDTVAITFGTSAGSHALMFNELSEFSAAQSIVLIDKFTGATTNVMSNPVYHFSVSSDAASQGYDRFKLVFKLNVVLPVHFVKVSAARKGNTTTEVSWQTADETNTRNYTVERSLDGSVYSAIGTVTAKGGVANSYSFADGHATPGISYYRIGTTDAEGRTILSNIAIVAATTNGQSIVLYPNPVKDKLTVIMKTAGSYRIRVLSIEGKVLLQQSGVAEGSSIQVPVSKLARGVYMVEVENAGKEKTVIKVVKQ